MQSSACTDHSAEAGRQHRNPRVQESYAANLRLVQWFGKQSYLLASLLALLVLLPLLTDENTSRFWLSGIMTLIVIAGPLSLAIDKFGFYVSLILGIIMITNSWIGNIIDLAPFKFLADIITVLFFLHLGGLIFRQHVFQSKDVDAETLLGAVNAYICIGIMWAFAYFFVLQNNPEAFSGNFIATVSFEACVYLSFVTMTTLGYGDITPQTNAAAILTWTQALAGQLFIALTVARIVGLMVAKESHD